MSKSVRIGIVVVIILLAAAVLMTALMREEAPAITIGSIGPLTGDYASYGTEIKRGIELAVAEVNENGGVNGSLISMVFEDSKAEPAQGVSIARKFISVDKVPAIIGAVASSVTLAIAPIAEREGVILLSPASSSPEITHSGDYIFRNYPSDELEGRLVAEFAVQHDFDSAAVLTINNEYGVGLNRVFSSIYSSEGGKILVNDTYDEGTVDFRAILAKVRQAGPACVFIVGYGREMGLLVKQARELGVQSQFLSTVNFYDPEAIVSGGDAVEGVVFSSPVFDPKSREERIRLFVEEFQGKFGKEPDVWSAHGYDATLLLAEAMKTNGIEPDQIKAGLYAISDFPGVSGITSFDENGDVLKSAQFLTVKDGEFTQFAR